MKCNDVLCNTGEVGDEYIIICVSEFFHDEGIMLLGNRPHWNFVLFKQLLNCEIRRLTKQLCKFINIILSTFA